MPFTVRQMVLALKDELGYREGPNERNKFSKALGRPNEYWCQDMAQYLLTRLGGIDGPNTAYTPNAEIWYKKQGRLFTTPRVGDQFFVYFPSKRRVAHTGFVVGISDDGRTVYTIEGNTNPGGGRNGYGVFKRSRPVLARPGTAGIRSYGRPVYATPPSTNPAPVTDVVVKPKPGVSVRALQRAVHVGADGEWGPVTEAALHTVRGVAIGKTKIQHLNRRQIRNVQANVGTLQDGEWGPKSNKALKRTVAKIQAALRVAPDGDWGPITENAYQAARKTKFRAR